MKNPMLSRILTNLALLTLAYFQLQESHAAEANGVLMSELIPVSAWQGYGSLELDRSVQGQGLKIGQREFLHGLGTHANSRIVYDLGGRCTRFDAWVGVDAEMNGYTNSTVVFQVFGDGKMLV